MKELLIFFCLLGLSFGLQAQTFPEKWRADIEILRTELPARHPDLFTHFSKKEFEAELAALSANLTGKTDFQIALQLQSIVSRFGDENTRLELKPLLMQQNPIPFGLGWYADGLYVSGTVKRFEKSMQKKVLKINGLPTADALSKVGVLIAKENEFGVRKDALSWFRFPTAFRYAGLGATDTLTFLLEAKDGKQETVKLFPIDLNNRADMAPAQIQQEKRDIRWQPATSIFSIQWLPKDSVLYAQYNHCISQEMALEMGDSLSASRLPVFQPFADSIVAFMHRTPGAKLFFDIRFNSGGGASDGIRLAKRLAEIPSVNKKEKLFVALNLYTSGAAVQVATVFSQLTQATLIGDPPATAPNHFDEIRAFTLPNTGLQVFHSTKFIRTMKGNPTTLSPDVLLEMKFEDFKAGRDPVLDYVRSKK